MIEKKLKCPVCNKEVNNLISHCRTHYPEILDKETFYQKFPTYSGALQIDKRKKNICKCQYCEATYSYNNLLALHIKNKHPEYYKKEDNRVNAKLQCPICNKFYADIKLHINRAHLLDWETFCKLYNWDIKLTKYVSDLYRLHLSENKHKFYNTSERGKELRLQLALKWIQNNPSKDRNLISKSIFKRSSNNNIPTLSYRGIKVNYDNYTFRSYTEFTFYIICKEYNIDLIYESNKYIINYYNSKKLFITTYLPDFYIPHINLLLELKALPHDEKIFKMDEKYSKAKLIYTNQNINYLLLCLSNAIKLLNITLLPYQIRDILKKYVTQAIEDNKIEFWCKSNSRTIKLLLSMNTLDNIPYIHIIKN